MSFATVEDSSSELVRYADDGTGRTVLLDTSGTSVVNPNSAVFLAQWCKAADAYFAIVRPDRHAQFGGAYVSKTGSVISPPDGFRNVVARSNTFPIPKFSIHDVTIFTYRSSGGSANVQLDGLKVASARVVDVNGPTDAVGIGVTNTGRYMLCNAAGKVLGFQPVSNSTTPMSDEALSFQLDLPEHAVITGFQTNADQAPDGGEHLGMIVYAIRQAGHADTYHLATFPIPLTG